MYKYILILILFPTIAFADIAAFYSDEGSGLMFDLEAGDKFLYKGELVLSNALAGFGVGVGYNFHGLKLFVGKSQATGMREDLDIDIGGTVKNSSVKGSGNTTFFEAKYSYFYARYNLYNFDYDHSAQIVTGTDVDGSPIIERKTVDTNTRDNVLFLGLRVPFK